MWLKMRPDGTPDVEGVTKPYCYHIDQFSELQPIIHKVIEYGQALGLDMIQGDHEDAPGQIELNFNFGRAEDTADGIRTYSYQSYMSSKIFGARSGFYGLAPMSHELAEWLANPYLVNEVPAWTEPSNPQYGCSTELEVGDPLVGKVLSVAKQIYQDEAYLSFFARQKPSTAWRGRYSWFGNFKTYSRSC